MAQLQVQPQNPVVQQAVGNGSNNPAIQFVSTSLYVGDMEPSVTDGHIFKLFQQIGPVISVRICRVISTKSSLGYAYVNYNSAENVGFIIEGTDMAEGFKFQSDLQSPLPTGIGDCANPFSAFNFQPRCQAADGIEDTSNAAKISEVQAWLSSLFEASGKEIPEFEYTASAVAHLHTVARVSQARTQAAQVITSDLCEKAAEYRTQAARFREISDGMGLASENLSQSALASINVLGTVANSLNIKDTETSSFLVGMTDLLLRKTEVEEKRSKAQKESNTLLENIRKAITHLTHLKRTVAELEEEAGRRESIMQQRENNLKIMDSKERQYVVQLANFKTLLSRVGYTPEISHGVLIQMVEKRKELERKTKPILNALRTYQDLPPDKSLAEMAIEEKRRKCEAAEKYLEDVLHSALNTPSE